MRKSSDPAAKKPTDFVSPIRKTITSHLFTLILRRQSNASSFLVKSIFQPWRSFSPTLLVLSKYPRHRQPTLRMSTSQIATSSSRERSKVLGSPVARAGAGAEAGSEGGGFGTCLGYPSRLIQLINTGSSSASGEIRISGGLFDRWRWCWSRGRSGLSGHFCQACRMNDI
jgi:hypothetical protein